mmetsp:Transcript_38834/g.103087  ORF Transcript_38834/g.103087 Transcript_38834/m.103087 type:complete len:211 (+) Transcript_38834:277-909(+)
MLVINHVEKGHHGIAPSQQPITRPDAEVPQPICENNPRDANCHEYHSNTKPGSGPTSVGQTTESCDLQAPIGPAPPSHDEAGVLQMVRHEHLENERREGRGIDHQKNTLDQPTGEEDVPGRWRGGLHRVSKDAVHPPMHIVLEVLAERAGSWLKVSCSSAPGRLRQRSVPEILQGLPIPALPARQDTSQRSRIGPRAFPWWPSRTNCRTK